MRTVLSKTEIRNYIRKKFRDPHPNAVVHGFVTSHFKGQNGVYTVLPETLAISQGNMSHVYYVETDDLRVIAKAANDNGLVETRRAYIFHEGHLLSELRHPNIVEIIDVGTDPCPFLILELLEGKRLDREIAEARIENSTAIRIMIQLCDAVHHAHVNGIVHRDIKPSNVFLIGEQIRLFDFGLSAFLETQKNIIKPVEGQVAGTPEYMSPEQKSGKLPSILSDIFLLGGTLYHMLFNRTPRLTGKVEDLKRLPPSPEVPKEIAEIIMCALATDPSARFKTALEMKEALEGIRGK